MQTFKPAKLKSFRLQTTENLLVSWKVWVGFSVVYSWFAWFGSSWPTKSQTSKTFEFDWFCQAANLGFRLVCLLFTCGLNLVCEVCEFLSNQCVNQWKPALVQTRKSVRNLENWLVLAQNQGLNSKFG